MQPGNKNEMLTLMENMSVKDQAATLEFARLCIAEDLRRSPARRSLYLVSRSDFNSADLLGYGSHADNLSASVSG